MLIMTCGYRSKYQLSQIITIIIGLIVSNVYDTQSIWLLYFYVISVIVSYTYLFIKELKYNNDFQPYHILILSTIQFVGFNGWSTVSKVYNDEPIYFGITNISDKIHLGLLFLIIQHLLMFSAFFWVEKKKCKYTNTKFDLYTRITQSSINYYKWGLKVYFLVWILRLLNKFVPLASISSILMSLSDMGHLITLYMLLFQIMKENRSRYRMAHWVIVLLEIVLVLNSGMKENIIRNLIPYCIYLFIMYKQGLLKFNFSFVSKFIGIILFVVFFVFPYVSIYRENYSLGEKNVNFDYLISEYIDYVCKEGKYHYEDVEDKGVDYVMSRAGIVACNTWAINETQINGIHPVYIYYNVIALIPRILWKDKPNIVVGQMMYRYSMGSSNFEETSKELQNKGECSISIGFIGSCYFSLGIVGAILIPFLLSLFIQYYWYFIKERIVYNIIGLWLFVGLIATFLKDCESFQNCGIIFFGLSCMYMFVMKKIYKAEKYRKLSLSNLS